MDQDSESDDKPIRTVITMLGTGRYNSVRYVWGDHRCETDLFPTALLEWLRPERVHVLCTAAVLNATEDSHLTRLQAAIPASCELKTIPIPDGRSEDELWDVFNAVITDLPPNSRLTLDVTHGFRSLPMVALLAALFLRAGGDSELEHILYGAYDAREPDSSLVPVFDLRPFLSMAEWMSAAATFARTGHAAQIAELLGQKHQEIWKTADDATRAPKQLKGLGKCLNAFSEALTLARISELPGTGQNVQQRLSGASEELSRWVQPFQAIQGRLEELIHDFPSDDLATQFRLIRWYVRNGHVVAALTLAREWVISYAAESLTQGWQDWDTRPDVEYALSRAQHLSKDKPEGVPLEQHLCDLAPQQSDARLYQSLMEHPQAGIVIRLWNRIADLRNDVAHCGMRARPVAATQIHRSVASLVEEMQPLAGDAGE